MKTFPQISEAEFEVMKVLWELNCATSSQIVDRLSKIKKWNPKTVHTLISRLVAKGAVKAERKTNKAFLYSPIINENEFRAHASESFLRKVFDGSLSLLIASFIKEQKLSKQEIENLKKILEDES